MIILSLRLESGGDHIGVASLDMDLDTSAEFEMNINDLYLRRFLAVSGNFSEMYFRKCISEMNLFIKLGFGSKMNELCALGASGDASPETGGYFWIFAWCLKNI